jgi:hypothetical protein
MFQPRKTSNDRQSQQRKELPMKNQIQIKSLIVGAFLALAAIIGLGAVGGDKDRTSWEYKLISEQIGPPESKALNDAGSLGWEAVGIGVAEDRWRHVLLKRSKK